MNIFITTQMRTGSTWLCDLISGLFNTKWQFWERGKDIPTEKFRDFIKQNQHNKNMANVIKCHYTHPKTICDAIPKGCDKNYVISITRDVRDIAVSKILYMRYDTPMRSIDRLKPLNDMRKKFDNENVGDRRYINLFINSPDFKHVIRNWKMYNDGFSHPNYMLIDYETLHARRLFVMNNICNFLGIHRNHKALRQIIVSNNFSSKSGRPNGKEVNNSFRRKGIVGDWKNYINKANLQRIQKLLKDD